MAPHSTPLIPDREDAPIFPLEIFTRIIEHLAQPAPVRNRNRWQLFTAPITAPAIKDLKRCALVCTSFVPLCQAHMLRDIRTVGYHYWTEGHVPRPVAVSSASFASHMKILQRSPALCVYVKELHLVANVPRMVGNRMTQKEIDACEAVLEQCRNTTHFSLTFDYFNSSLNDGGSDTQSWKEMCGRILQVHISRGTLKHIRLSSMDSNFDLPHLFRLSPALTRLSLSKLHYNVLALQLFTPDLTIAHLTHLDIEYAPSFRLSLLKHFPNLTHLHFHEITIPQSDDNLNAGSTDPRSPSFALRHLDLESVDQYFVHAFIEFYIRESKAAGRTPPFSDLNYVSLTSRQNVDFDTAAAQRLLELTPHLEVLVLQERYGPEFMFSLGLEKLIPSVFSGLTTLVLLSPSRVANTIALQALFESISGRNTLVSLELLFSAVEFYPAVVAVFDVRGWGDIACTLASVAGFPCLESVKVQLKMPVECKGVLKDPPESGDVVAAMCPLQHRFKLGAGFVGEIVIW